MVDMTSGHQGNHHFHSFVAVRMHWYDMDGVNIMTHYREKSVVLQSHFEYQNITLLVIYYWFWGALIYANK